jgi:hypothetical protein
MKILAPIEFKVVGKLKSVVRKVCGRCVLRLVVPEVESVVDGHPSAVQLGKQPHERFESNL